jgi:hypothetical protein
MATADSTGRALENGEDLGAQNQTQTPDLTILKSKKTTPPAGTPSRHRHWFRHRAPPKAASRPCRRADAANFALADLAASGVVCAGMSEILGEDIGAALANAECCIANAPLIGI